MLWCSNERSTLWMVNNIPVSAGLVAVILLDLEWQVSLSLWSEVATSADWLIVMTTPAYLDLIVWELRS